MFWTQPVEFPDLGEAFFDTNFDGSAVLAEQFDLHQRQVVIALNYAAAHRDEVEERVTANDRALEEAERVAAERQRLLA